MPKKGDLGQFPDLGGAWQKIGGGIFEGGLMPLSKLWILVLLPFTVCWKVLEKCPCMDVCMCVTSFSHDLLQRFKKKNCVEIHVWEHEYSKKALITEKWDILTKFWPKKLVCFVLNIALKIFLKFWVLIFQGSLSEPKWQ